MMSEVMRLATFFATLSVAGLFLTSIALAAAGATNTSGVPLLCRDCAAATTVKLKPPNVVRQHAGRMGLRPFSAI